MSPALPSSLTCEGCGLAVDATGAAPFTCPRRKPNDGVDHLLARHLDAQSLSFPADPDPNPFVAFRKLLHSYHVARAHGLSDAEFVDLVHDLDERVAAIDGTGFRRTPLTEAPALSRAAGFGGTLWVKDETQNVSGSHKARHLMGLVLHLEVSRKLGLATGKEPLAISSCGNAALGAAVVARAAGRALKVFVPTWANEKVVQRLKGLGAEVVTAVRAPGATGDPCTERFRAEVAQGAVPFSCQGPDNGLVLEGGMTLAYEVVAAGLNPDCVFVQVGGGALGSACASAFREAVAFGKMARLPRLYAVQTEGAAPLRRAYLGVLGRVLKASGRKLEFLPSARSASPSFGELDRWAAAAKEVEPAVLETELSYAARHRSEFMWPWEHEPKSAAHGILDDETYDWLNLVRGMLESGGFPVVVSEDELESAFRLSRGETRIVTDHTGAAGLAGLFALSRAKLLPPGETALLLFTGKDRSAHGE